MMKYRADIDGLRAVAVIAVVLFHARINIFGGGYVGVDVFFVISGYLITSLITQEIESGRFTLSMFYERRIRRIFPAFFAVVFATALASTFVLLPGDFDSFGRSVIAATLFSSNVLFWHEANYFEGAEIKPLLHTWSLAVEEQFYIVFPVLLLIVSRFLKRRWRTILLAIAIGSFALSVWAVQNTPTAAFYLAPTRAWELLLGSLLALRTIPPVRNALILEVEAVAGLAMIAWSVVAFDWQTTFPGPAALVPCVGTALVVHAGTSATPTVNRLLSRQPIVFVGLVSYSLYLWHWPALVLARHQIITELSGIETALVLAFSSVAAVLSWRFVERPFRGRGRILKRRSLFLSAGTVALLALTMGSIGPLTAGLPARWVDYQEVSVPGREHYREGTCFLRQKQTYNDWDADKCFIDANQSSNMLWWGDSFAAHYAPGLDANVDSLPRNVLQYTAWGCAPVFGYNPKFRPNCGEFNERASDIIELYDIDTVVLTARWWLALEQGMELHMLDDTIERLQKDGLNVIVIGQSPDFISNMNVLVNRTDYMKTAPTIVDFGLNRKISQHVNGAKFIDPLFFLCEQERCQFRDQGDFLFWDEGHLSVLGADRMIKYYLPVLSSDFTGG